MSSPQRVIVPVTQAVTAISKGNKTVFTCHSAIAEQVFLAGSFNDWSATATPMSKGKGGQWTASLPLGPGHHEYKFVVDGDWCCEPGCTSETVHCQHCIVNEFGTMNRVLEI